MSRPSLRVTKVGMFHVWELRSSLLDGARLRLVISSGDKYALTGPLRISVEMHAVEDVHGDRRRCEHGAAREEGHKLGQVREEDSEHDDIEGHAEEVVDGGAHLLRHELGLDQAHRGEVNS